MFNTRGTTLYFAILVLSVIFTISIGLNLIIFSRMGIQREIGYSIIAFYAADTGVERALYAIYKEGNLSFSASTTMENGASYNVFVATSSTQCGTPVRYYCIKSRGTFREVTKTVDVSF